MSQGSTFCAQFKIGFTEHHKIYIKEEKTIELNEKLSTCQSVAKKLEETLKNGTAQIAASGGIIQPFRENYYYEKYYPKQVTVPGVSSAILHDQNAEGNWKYDKNFYDYLYGMDPKNPAAINEFCRIYIEEGSHDLVSYELRNRPKYSDGKIHSDDEQVITKCGDIKVVHECSQKNVFKYDLKYQTEQSGDSKPIVSTETHKCENITLNLKTEGEWFQTGPTKTLDENASKLIELSDAFTHNILAGYSVGVHMGYDMFVSPPTDISSCGDQSNCLSSSTTKETLKGMSGKGVHKVPSDFNSLVQKTLSAETDSEYIKCNDGKCVARASGERHLASSIPATSYFGQCKNQIIDLNLPEVPIPSAKSDTIFNVVNRVPLVSISFPNSQSITNLKTDETIKVTCDIIDPDDCCDKITKVKWSCFNSQNKQENCHFLSNTDIWQTGSLTEELGKEKIANPYRSVVSFKSSVKDSYAIACEAFDNDINTGKQVKSSFDKLNSNNNSDNFFGGNSDGGSGYGLGGLNVSPELTTNYGVLPEKVKFCNVFTDQGSSKTLCEDSAEVKIEAYTSETLHPKEYKWDCKNGKGEETTESPNHKCTYSESGKIYYPSLSIKETDGTDWITCISQAKINMAGGNKSSCLVLIREAGSVDDFVSDLKIYANTEVEAKISRICLNQNVIDWSVANGTKTKEDKNEETANFVFPAAGQGSIKAKIKDIDCKQANLTVKDKIYIR